jgi:hypothetical protein
MWGALSDERTGLSLVYAAGPRQRSLSRVQVPWDSWPYFTVSDLRLHFSSPPTTRRATVEVFDPASTRGGLPCRDFLSWTASGLVLYSHGMDNSGNTVLLLRSADHTESRSHTLAISPVHWRVDCCLATNYKHSSCCCMRLSRCVYRTVAWQCVDMTHYV